MADVGVLNLNIHSESTQAEDGLRRLEGALRAIKNATENTGLGKVANALKKINESISVHTVTNLNGVAAALQKIQAACNFTIPNLSGLNRVRQSLSGMANSAETLRTVHASVENIAEGFKEFAPVIGKARQELEDFEKEVRSVPKLTPGSLMGEDREWQRFGAIVKETFEIVQRMGSEKLYQNFNSVEAEKGIAAINNELKVSSDLVDQFSIKFQQFMQMFYAWMDMRSSKALGAGVFGLPKSTAIEVEGTVTEAKTAISGFIASSSELNNTVETVTEKTESGMNRMASTVSQSTEKMERDLRNLKNMLDTLAEWKSLSKADQGLVAGAFKDNPLFTGIFEKLSALKGTQFDGFVEGIRRIIDSSSNAETKIKELYSLMEKVSAAAEKMKTIKSVSFSTKDMAEEARKTADNFRQANGEIETMARRIDELKIRLGTGLMIGGMDAKEILSISNEIERLQTKMEKAQAALESGANVIPGNVAKDVAEEFRKANNEITLTESRIEELKIKLGEGIIGGTMDTKALLSVSGEIDRLEAKLHSLKTEASRMSSISNMFAGLKKEIKGLFPGLSKLGSMFTNIAKRMMIRAAIRLFVQGMKEGLENMYYWSKANNTEFAPSMDRLATSVLDLKNSLGAMAAEVVIAVMPVLSDLIDYAIQIVNWINQVFATINGKSTFKEYVRGSEKVTDVFGQMEKSAKGTSKAVKEMLADWDELNIIQSENSGSGGGVGAALDKTVNGSDYKDTPITDSTAIWVGKNWPVVAAIAALIKFRKAFTLSNMGDNLASIFKKTGTVNTSNPLKDSEAVKESVDKTEKMTQETSNTVNAIKEDAKETLSKTEEATREFLGEGRQGLIGGGEEETTATKQIAGYLKQSVENEINEIRRNSTDLWERISRAGAPANADINTSLSSEDTIIRLFLDNVPPAISSGADLVENAIRNESSILSSDITTAIDGGTERIVGAIDAGANGPDYTQDLENIGSTVRSEIASLTESTIDAVSNGTANVVNAVERINLGNGDTVTAIEDASENAGTQITALTEGVQEAINGGASNVAESISGETATLTEGVQEAINGGAGNVVASIGSETTTLTEGVQAAIDGGVGNVAGSIGSETAKLTEGIQVALSSGAGDISEAIEHINVGTGSANTFDTLEVNKLQVHTATVDEVVDNTTAPMSEELQKLYDNLTQATAEYREKYGDSYLYDRMGPEVRAKGFLAREEDELARAQEGTRVNINNEVKRLVREGWSKDVATEAVKESIKEAEKRIGILTEQIANTKEWVADAKKLENARVSYALQKWAEEDSAYSPPIYPHNWKTPEELRAERLAGAQETMSVAQATEAAANIAESAIQVVQEATASASGVVANTDIPGLFGQTAKVIADTTSAVTNMEQATSGMATGIENAVPRLEAGTQAVTEAVKATQTPSSLPQVYDGTAFGEAYEIPSSGMGKADGGIGVARVGGSYFMFNLGDIGTPQDLLNKLASPDMDITYMGNGTFGLHPARELTATELSEGRMFALKKGAADFAQHIPEIAAALTVASVVAQAASGVYTEEEAYKEAFGDKYSNLSPFAKLSVRKGQGSVTPEQANESYQQAMEQLATNTPFLVPFEKAAETLYGVARDAATLVGSVTTPALGSISWFADEVQGYLTTFGGFNRNKEYERRRGVEMFYIINEQTSNDPTLEGLKSDIANITNMPGFRVGLAGGDLSVPGTHLGAWLVGNIAANLGWRGGYDSAGSDALAKILNDAGINVWSLLDNTAREEYTRYLFNTVKDEEGYVRSPQTALRMYKEAGIPFEDLAKYGLKEDIWDVLSDKGKKNLITAFVQAGASGSEVLKGLAESGVSLDELVNTIMLYNNEQTRQSGLSALGKIYSGKLADMGFEGLLSPEEMNSLVYGMAYDNTVIDEELLNKILIATREAFIEQFDFGSGVDIVAGFDQYLRDLGWDTFFPSLSDWMYEQFADESNGWQGFGRLYNTNQLMAAGTRQEYMGGLYGGGYNAEEADTAGDVEKGTRAANGVLESLLTMIYNQLRQNENRPIEVQIAPSSAWGQHGAKSSDMYKNYVKGEF